MPLAALPADLVRSLMHSLQLKEILSLARCSKFTLECADSAFAWRDCSPLEVNFQAELMALPTRFSRWIPLALRKENGSLTEAQADRLLVCLHSWPRVVSLPWDEWKLSVERGVELLRHPALRNLQNVGLCSDLPAEWLSALVSLPSITELDLVRTAITPDMLQPLVHALELRNLYVAEEHSACLSAVMQLAQLRHLCVYEPRLNGDNFLAFCRAMSGLKELWLQSWATTDVRSISAADLAAGLSSFLCLHTLSIDNQFDAETLAPVLHLPPALRRMSVPCFETANTPVLLAQLLLLAPLLELHLQTKDDRVSLVAAREALKAQTA